MSAEIVGRVLLFLLSYLSSFSPFLLASSISSHSSQLSIILLVTFIFTLSSVLSAQTHLSTGLSVSRPLSLIRILFRLSFQVFHVWITAYLFPVRPVQSFSIHHNFPLRDSSPHLSRYFSPPPKFRVRWPVSRHSPPHLPTRFSFKWARNM